jgi:hypothetical protein
MMRVVVANTVKQFRDVEEGIVSWLARELQMLRDDDYLERTRSYSHSPTAVSKVMSPS